MKVRSPTYILSFNILYPGGNSSDLMPWKQILLRLLTETALNELVKLLSRSLSAKFCIQVWGDAASYEDIKEQIM